MRKRVGVGGGGGGGEKEHLPYICKLSHMKKVVNEAIDSGWLLIYGPSCLKIGTFLPNK
jgi:hypothetical protein